MSDRPPSDREVIERCRRGEVEPFGVLVKRYQDRVYNLAYRLLGDADEALDAAQDAFVRAYAALERFDPSRPFAPWLYRIATNACIALLRRRRPEIVSLDALLWEEQGCSRAAAREPRDSEDPQRLLERAAHVEEIQAAVQALPEGYRTILLLRYQEDMSYDAIAQVLGVPLGTVKTHLHRARQLLRRALLEEHSP
jgi:RNA polymerase sigma-70 factor (ECF subfamily)